MNTQFILHVRLGFREVTLSTHLNQEKEALRVEDTASEAFHPISSEVWAGLGRKLPPVLQNLLGIIYQVPESSRYHLEQILKLCYLGGGGKQRTSLDQCPVEIEEAGLQSPKHRHQNFNKRYKKQGLRALSEGHALSCLGPMTFHLLVFDTNDFLILIPRVTEVS